jgi:hypothetical protein
LEATDDELVARAAVDQAGAARLPGLASGRGEHERAHPVVLVSLGAARGQVRAGVLGDPLPLRVGGAVKVFGDGHIGGPFQVCDVWGVTGGLGVVSRPRVG